VAVLALAWAAIAAYTGGFRLQFGGLRLSARGARNPLLAAAAGLVIAWALGPAGARRQALAADLAVLGVHIPAWARTPWAATVVAAVAALAVGLIGLTEGSRTAGASDSYGYVSQARMFSSGQLRVDEPLMRAFRGYDRRAFTPLGWVPDPQRDAVIPAYPPGLPLMMAAFERAGGPTAVFLVVPLLGALTVWATFILGRGVAGDAAGAAAAVLIASSPTLLYQLTTGPMSDVPATAWWVTCLALIARSGPWAACVAGLAAGAAIMTRPNLVPLTIAPVLLLMWPLRDAAMRGAAVVRLLAFAPGVLLGSATVATFNQYWFGSPLTSGYGSLDPLYSWSFAWPNIRNFSTWLAETQTPLIALAIAGPFALRHLSPASSRQAGATAALTTFVLAVLGLYLFYFPFEPWWNLRFILPAFPVVMVFMAAALVVLGQRWRGDQGLLAAAALVLALSAHGVATARERSAFDTAMERRYVHVGHYVRDHLPDRTVVLAVLHSGSIRLYADRPTIRWDWLAPDELDPLIGRLVALGFDPYLVVEREEVATLRKRFEGASAVSHLELPLIAQRSDGHVRIFGLAGQPPPAEPAVIPADGSGR
jgi:hypothetical protein